jgi:2-methylaconitate cis-trans-isomerase PrpF
MTRPPGRLCAPTRTPFFRTARRALDFGQTAGGVTGSLLPTGRELDVLDTELGPVEVSIVDVSNLTVFLPAGAVGMTGIELPDEYGDEQLAAIEAVKRAAAELIGIGSDGLIPVPSLVAEPADFTSYATGEVVPAGEFDLIARVVGGRPPVPHKAYPGTVGACTGVAACIPGTTVHRVRRQREDGEIRIGHMSGVMPVRARVSRSGEGWQVEEAVYYRTARRLAEGTAYVRTSAFSSGSGER